MIRTLTIVLAAATSFAQVTHERLTDSSKEPQNWLTYSGNFQGHRFSALKQIDTSNVARLRPAWVFQMDLNFRLETSPLIVDGVMYITEPPSNVSALDARTGRPFWRYKRPQVNDVVHCCGHVNRGLAILGDTLFLGTIDAHMVALDRATGRVRWDVPMESYKSGYSSTGAPLALKDKVISGIAGGEFGVRGFISAFDA
ncbi:MAG: PQQ-binding-like beta-propeller repeat protein, partial [Acidobacteriia bacterium]|nr:PQQ-binding-like beta-propeller repeat protein [Terriglobia bacterium]